jgi:hypothetical protein
MSLYTKSSLILNFRDDDSNRHSSGKPAHRTAGSRRRSDSGVGTMFDLTAPPSQPTATVDTSSCINLVVNAPPSPLCEEALYQTMFQEEFAVLCSCEL